MTADPLALIVAAIGVLGGVGTVCRRTRPSTVDRVFQLAEKYIEGRLGLALERERRETIIAASAVVQRGVLLCDRRADGGGITVRADLQPDVTSACMTSLRGQKLCDGD